MFSFAQRAFLVAICSIIIMGIVMGCSLQSEKNDCNLERSVSFMTWNTQTFFDGTTEGTEYRDFAKSVNWSEEKYKIRLERLWEVLEAINADIIVLQEIENEAVMQDISNMMAEKSWNRKQGWPYGGFSKNEKEALGCGIFSRYPISDIKTHNLDIKSEDSFQPPLRPIMEVSINVEGKNLVVFINHWKSKSGGAEISEKWRNWQENVLCQCIENLEKKGIKNCIAAGDFNKDISEFTIIKETSDEKANVALKSAFSKSEKMKVYSPWIQGNGAMKEGIGSYYFRDKWSRIDNIFAWGNITISDFEPMACEPWTFPDSVPIKYMIYNGKGYSDHLPLFCSLTF